MLLVVVRTGDVAKVVVDTVLVRSGVPRMVALIRKSNLALPATEAVTSQPQ